MPICRKAEEAGVFNPSDVALLGRAFDRLKIGQNEGIEPVILGTPPW